MTSSEMQTDRILKFPTWLTHGEALLYRFPIFGSEAQHQIVHLQAYLRLRLFTSLTKPAMGKDKSEKKEKKEKKQKEVKEDTKVNEDVEMVDAVEVPVSSPLSPCGLEF